MTRAMRLAAPLRAATRPPLARLPAARPFSSSRFALSSQPNLRDDQFAAPPAARVQRPAPRWEARALVPSGEFASVSLDQFAGRWLVLFFYPLDFTFVCPTEIVAFSDRIAEFNALGADVVGVSVDSVHSHLAWANQPRKVGGLGPIAYPLVSDITKNISHAYGVLVEDGPDAGIAARGTFIIDPKGIIRQISINDLGVGRSVDETLRLLEAYQFVDQHGQVCPANWRKGGDTIIADPVKSKDYFNSAN